MYGKDLHDCMKCGERKPTDAFYPSSLTNRRPLWCKSCRREYNKDRVKEDPNYFLKYTTKRRKAGYERVAALKSAMGCNRCGYNEHHCALDFHHRDPSQKKFNIPWGWVLKWSKLLEEIAKCDLLCSNCHRIHHFEERAAKRKAIAEVTK